ncbi:hypothetical protein MRX96_053178 [Rhipicephalus microplus]
MWIVLARRNTVSREVVCVGWLQIIIALTVSSFGGFILDYAVFAYPQMDLHLSSVNDFMMSTVVVLSTKCEKNPGNIAPAIAASFDDLTTLFLLSGYCTIRVLVLLYLARLIVYHLWMWGVDPDNTAIPCLTGCGDFLGTGFLTMAYALLYQGGEISRFSVP